MKLLTQIQKAYIKLHIRKEMLLDYRVVEGKGFYTIERKIAHTFLGFPYRIKFYPVTELHKSIMGFVANTPKTFANKVAAANYIKSELSNIDMVLDKVKEAKK